MILESSLTTSFSHYHHYVPCHMAEALISPHRSLASDVLDTFWGLYLSMTPPSTIQHNFSWSSSHDDVLQRLVLLYDQRTLVFFKNNFIWCSTCISLLRATFVSRWGCPVSQQWILPGIHVLIILAYRHKQVQSMNMPVLKENQITFSGSFATIWMSLTRSEGNGNLLDV